MRNLAYLMLLTAACSNETKQINITKTVGVEGGTVSNTDGTSVKIPMGALTTSSNITISSVTATAPTGTVIVGPAYDFGPEGTTFAQPVTITLPYDSAKIPAGRTASDVRIYSAPRGSTNYTIEQTALSGGIVATTTTHFTVYLPAVATAVTGTDLGSGGGCTPSCTSSGLTCGCAGSCGGVTYVLSCSQETTGTPASCGCTANGSPIATSIILDSCNQSEAQLAWQTQCVPN